ncbi:Cof-type HAD-IIB family hydrolase [Streptobacillus canis]|uniref:Cof-type HAD-IIB family hydrolase n=1 Tax=Streptobacillus canis TaxID=2678686 RepID=UPI0018CC02D1|nr:Cof-type HAD-IIB family hydrolase [Streptobacillus canis]
MSKIRLISFDLDGTILKNSKLSEGVIKAFHKLEDSGIMLVVNTGRSIDSLYEMFDLLKLSGKGNYAILTTGAVVQHIDTREIIKHFSLTLDDYRYIRENIEQGYDLSVYTPEKLYYVDKIFPEIVEDNDVLLQEMGKFEEDENIEISRVNIMGPKEKLDEFEKNHDKKFLERFYHVRTIPISIEILNKNASKGNGLKAFMEELNIDPSEAIAIGDGNNDISMFKVVEYSVAMGNATDLVKSHAKYVTDSIDNDGFVKMLEMFELI